MSIVLNCPAVRLPERRCTIDVYRLGASGDGIGRKDAEFQRSLDTDMGVRLIPVSNDDQLKSGINSLCIGSNRILSVAGSAAAFRSALCEVRVTWMDFGSLTVG